MSGVILTAEAAEALFFAELARHDWGESSGQPETQQQARLRAWESVITSMRQGYAAENDRLRDRERYLEQRVHDLEQLVIAANEAAAEAAAA